VFYLVAGIVASLAQVAVFPESQAPMIGASGAVAGVLAGYLLLFPRAPVRLILFLGPFLVLGRVAAMVLIGLWVALQFFQGFLMLRLEEAEAEGVAYFAHIGGFLAGSLLTLVIRAARGERLGSFRRGYLWGPVFRNWLLVILALVVTLVAGALIAATVSPVLGGLIQGLAVVAAGLVALIDGLIRVAGRPSLLGTGRGAGRLLALIQTLAGLGILVASRPG
jgi:hypothetical protein